MNGYSTRNQWAWKITFRASPLGERLAYYPNENIFFVNFEGHQVKSSEQIKKIDDAVSKILEPVDKSVVYRREL